MSRIQKSKWCRRCKAYTLHLKSEARKMGCATHILLTVGTCGLWLPLAMLIVVLEMWSDILARYHCQQCGKRR